MKIIIFIFLLQSLSFGYCATKSCNETISYAMGKHRKFVKERMNDLKTTIIGLREANKSLNEVCLLDNFEAMRLKARFLIESQKVVETRHYHKKDEELKMIKPRIIKGKLDDKNQ